MRINNEFESNPAFIDIEFFWLSYREWVKIELLANGVYLLLIDKNITNCSGIYQYVQRYSLSLE